jgi:hypothetical protein
MHDYKPGDDMNKKQFPFLLLIIWIIVLLIGCTATTPKIVIPTNFEETANPMAENLIVGLDKQDYAIFTRDFDEKIIKALPATAMTELHKLLWNQNGNFQSMVNKKSFEEKGYFISIFNLVFEKGNLDMQLVFNPEPPNKISGLWFPPK